MHLFSSLLPGLFRMYMCMQSTIITAVASPLPSLAADAASPAPLAPVVPRQLFQFADGTNIENIHVRPNDHLLLSSISTGNLFTLDPTAAVPFPLVVANLSGSTGLTGMVTIDTNAGLFAISGGVHTSFNFVQGSMAVYVVSVPSNSNTGSVRSRISVNGTLNGMAALPLHPYIILTADSIGGQIFRVNTRTGAVDVPIADPALGSGGNTNIPLGINGLKIYNGYVYFTNSGRGTFARVKIDAQGNKAGDFEVLATLLQNGGVATRSNAYDDFTFDGCGNAYVALHSYTFVKITPEGSQTTWVGSVGNYTDVFEPSSAAASLDGNIIYLSTAGATINGVVHGGQVLEVKI
jgi:hypothetical protein